MEYQEFKNKLKEEIGAYLPKDYRNWSFTESKVYKVNLILDGLSLQPPEIVPCGGVFSFPIIYPEELYQTMERGTSYEEILDMVLKIILESKVPDSIEAYQELNDDIKDHIIIQLINRDKNMEYLEKLPHQVFLNFAIVCKVFTITENNDIYCTMVTKDMMRKMGMTEDELFERAYRQTQENLTPKILELSEGNMFVLTNQHNYLGAAGILCINELSNLANQLNSDLVLLPSSIHEFIIVPEKQVELKNMKALVLSANQEVVSNQEWLSDEVYYYSMKSNKITMVSE